MRAKRGEHGVVEGVFHSYPISSGWGIGSEAEEDGLFAWNDKGWTITDILRPVLVKGDRVEWEGLEGVVGWIAPSGIVQVDRLDKATIIAFARSDNLTRLPAAPEPAPVEVGDWLKSLMDKDSHVVTSVDGLDRHSLVAVRRHLPGESAVDRRVDSSRRPARAAHWQCVRDRRTGASAHG